MHIFCLCLENTKMCDSQVLINWILGYLSEKKKKWWLFHHWQRVGSFSQIKIVLFFLFMFFFFFLFHYIYDNRNDLLVYPSNQAVQIFSVNCMLLINPELTNPLYCDYFFSCVNRATMVTIVVQWNVFERGKIHSVLCFLAKKKKNDFKGSRYLFKESNHVLKLFISPGKLLKKEFGTSGSELFALREISCEEKIMR